MAPLILILFAYLRKVKRGIAPEQAADEAMRALKRQYPAYLEKCGD